MIKIFRKKKFCHLTSLFLTYVVIFGPKRRVFCFFCPPLVEYFEKNFCHLTSHFWRMTSFLAQKDVFFAFLAKMCCLHPFKVVFRHNYRRRCCSTWWAEYFEKFICHLTSHFDVWRHFWFKKTSFMRFLAKCVVYTLLMSFSGITVIEKVVPLD